MARKSKRVRRKAAPRRRPNVKKRGANFSGKEKKSFCRGFWKGFWISRKSKSKNSRKKQVSVKNSDYFANEDASVQIRMKAEIERMANAYARHMGRKFDLTEAEIQKNAKEHVKEAMNDPEMLAFLYREYG